MIKITLRNYRGFTSESPATFIIGDGFTAFVGRNNAGKSTCLRSIFELKNVIANHNFWLGFDVNNDPITIQCPAEPDPSVLLNYDNTAPAFVSIDIEPDTDSDMDQFIQSTIRIDRNGHVFLSSIKVLRGGSNQEFTPPFKKIIVSHEDGKAQLTTLTGMELTFTFRKFIQTLKSLSQSVYYGSYRNAINQGAAQYYDIAVGTQIIAQWDQWKAGPNVASKRAVATVQSDIKRLLGYDSLEINASADNMTLDVIVNGHPFKLADLGAGVAELIITLSNALVKNPSFIFIDEPESHLHPSLQVDFLTTLAGYATKGIAFATHSIGLARSVADRTYAITRQNEISSCALFEKQTHLAELLGNLSYSGYYPAENAFVLLVEGTTEVKTFQVLLRKLKKDHAYVILPLGGKSLIRKNTDVEINEVVRIAGGADKVFAIIDSERKEKDVDLDKEHKAFKSTCKKLGISLLVTERRATENYFSEIAIKKGVGNNFSALPEFCKLGEDGKGWNKNENWRIADSETLEFFKTHDLGKFLDELPTKN